MFSEEYKLWSFSLCSFLQSLRSKYSIVSIYVTLVVVALSSPLWPWEHSSPGSEWSENPRKGSAEIHSKPLTYWKGNQPRSALLLVHYYYWGTSPSLLPRQLLRASLLSAEVAAHPSESRWSHFYRCVTIIFLLFQGLLRIDRSNVKMADCAKRAKNIHEMAWLLLLSFFRVSFCLFCFEFQSILTVQDGCRSQIREVWTINSWLVG
jgi:hypothetical protein